MEMTGEQMIPATQAEDWVLKADLRIPMRR